jgi:hypothetical protein
MTAKQQIIYQHTQKIALNVTSALKKMEVVIICNVIIANTIFAGCVWETGRHMDQSIMSVPDIKKILILLMNQPTLKHERL